MYSDVAQSKKRRDSLTAAEIRENAGVRYAALALGSIAVLSALLYLAVFTLPYSLPKWYNWIHFDLERLQLRDRVVHWEMLLALAAQTVLYLLAWRAVRHARGWIAWTVVGTGAVAMAASLLLVYPFGSTDIFDYIMRGRMLGLHGANPFTVPATRYAWDLYYQYVGWPHATSAYGPLWEVMAAALARFVAEGYGARVIPNVLAFKLLSTLFLAASVVLVAVILRRTAPHRALTGVLLLAWNPVVLWETVGNGHNDIVMVFWLLLAILAMLYRRYTLAILALLAGTLLKFIPVLMVPAAGLIALRDLSGWRARLQFVLVTAGLSVLLLVASYAPFWDGPDVLSVERRMELFTTSLPTVLLFLLQPKLGMEQAASEISRAAAGLTALFALWEGFRAWQDRTPLSFARSVFDILIFYLLFTALWVWPWYTIWPLAVGIILLDRRAVLAQIAAFALMAKPWIWGWLLLNHPGFAPKWGTFRVVPAVMALPWFYTLYLLANSVRQTLTPAQRSIRTQDTER